AGAQRLAELRRGEADARGVAHGIRQIVEQPVQVLAEAVDGLAAQPEARVTKEDDGADAHFGREYSRGERRPRSLRTCVRRRCPWSPRATARRRPPCGRC